MGRGEDFDLGLAPSDRGARVRRALSKVHGLTLDNGFEGSYTVGSCSARVWIESDGSLRVLHEVEQPPSPREALEGNFHLPGNLRFAAAGGRMCLTADTRLDGELHLGHSFREISDGLRRALDRSWHTDRQEDEPISPEKVEHCLDNAEFEEDAVVRLDQSWELRPRIRGEARPVRLAIDGKELRMERVVMAGCQGESEPAVTFQALCFNARLRHARLAWTAGAVVAETRLHAGLVDPAWLVHAARAVATAAHYTWTALEILARQVDVARQFERAMFDGDRGEFADSSQGE